MRKPHNTTHRASGVKKRKAVAAGAERLEPAKTLPHPMYGDIPLIAIPYTDHTGRERVTYQEDPNYVPPMPQGAVRGDVRRQSFCRMCHSARYFYVDIERVCVQCAHAFVFRAAEQKHWYEVLGFHFDSTATRCLACRRKRRSALGAAQLLEHARREARKRPEDAAAQLALAEAIVRFVQSNERGPVHEGLAAARAARKLWRGHPGFETRETLFWEGMCHGLAGRAEKARDALTAFLDAGPAGRRQRALAKEARAFIAETQSA